MKVMLTVTYLEVLLHLDKITLIMRITIRRTFHIFKF